MLNKFKNDNNDLKINKCAVVKVTLPNILRDNVYKIDLSFYAIPKIQCSVEEYESKRDFLYRRISRNLKKYVSENDSIFNKDSIISINFTTANLRKGYNKSVQVSLFVMSKNKFSYENFRKRIRNTIKKPIKSITDSFREEGFICNKTKIVH